MEVPAVVEGVIVEGELVDGLPDVELPEAGENPEFVEGIATPDYDDLALRVALALKQIFQMGDQIAFLLVHPTLRDGLVAALNAMPDEAYPAPYKQNLGIFPDENVNPVKAVTQTDLEAQYLEQYYTANGVLPRLQHFLQTNQIMIQIAPGVTQPVNIPVRITLETLRALYAIELRDRLAPGIIRPPMGAQIDLNQIRK